MPLRRPTDLVLAVWPGRCPIARLASPARTRLDDHRPFGLTGWIGRSLRVPGRVAALSGRIERFVLAVLVMLSRFHIPMFPCGQADWIVPRRAGRSSR
jgi:hypothetical protein